MIKRFLLLFLIPYILLSSISTLRAQDALFTVHFAGKAQSPAAQQLLKKLQQLSQEYGFELAAWDANLLRSPSDYPDIVLAVEKGDLWRLNESDRNLFAEYFLGEKGRKGASLMIVRLEENQNTDETRVLNWPWLTSLIQPASPPQSSIVSLSQIPNQAEPRLRALVGQDWYYPKWGLYKRQLPHPMPQADYEGGKIMYADIFAEALAKSDQFFPDLQNLLVEGVLWAADLSDGSQLAVPQLELEVENKQAIIRLDWMTQSEQDNDYFEVLRSSGGADWESVLRLDAIGDKHSESHYDFEDHQLAPGRYYYRLKQVDRSGNVWLSTISVVDIVNPRPMVHLFPNPVQSVLTIDTHLGEESTLRYRIESISGETVWEQPAAGTHRFQRLEVPVLQLPPGIYQLHVQSESGERVQPFIKY